MPSNPGTGGGSPDELLRLALAGDEDAAKRLYEQSKERFVRLARKRGPDLAEDQHEEVVQEMWQLVGQRGLHAFVSSGASAQAYLSQVHRNAVESVRAAYRPAGTRSRFSDTNDQVGAVPLDMDVNQLEDVSLWSFPYPSIDFGIDLERFMAKVEPAVVRALTLILAEGSTISEAAAEVGLTRQTLSRRMHSMAAA
jgi:DNA-directed RNA polymerase specialized sigma24 family protein